ncbi:hypothetical protein CR983_01560 [Candidatus Saccharibacteria bacterium]|nr:MAG: hypothetical protein CR983_01560 [Candidatus Saccharibacteria bacterium]
MHGRRRWLYCAHYWATRDKYRLHDPLATTQTRHLYQYICSMREQQRILTGQQVSYTNEPITDEQNMQWLHTNTGRLPAIGGFDLMKYSPSREQNGDTGADVDRALAWASTNPFTGTPLASAQGTRGGIVAFCWHWNPPYGDPNANWWDWVYANYTTFRPASAMLDTSPGGGLDLLYRDIDHIAVQLRRLDQAGLSVIWRPMHEANNPAIFWWGADGAAAYKRLWRLVHDRIVNYHNLHNLIWTYAANYWPPGSYADTYPGDAYVDLIGLDSYDTDNYPTNASYAEIAATSKKPPVISETGYMPDPATLYQPGSEYDWRYFVTWGESVGSANYLGGTITSSYANAVYNDARTITREQLPDWQNGMF